MPWLSEAKKDVISCEKLRGGANNHWSVDIRMGQPVELKTQHSFNKKANVGNWNISLPIGGENNNDFASSGERTRKSPNLCCLGDIGVVGLRYKMMNWIRIVMENWAAQGESPVWVRFIIFSGILSSAGHEKSCVKQRGPSRKAKYSRETDSGQVPWGKGEKNLEQRSEIEPETVCLQAVGALFRCDGVPFA